MFKRGDLQNRFRVVATGYRFFVTVKVPTILLVTDLTSSTKNNFF